MTEEKSTSRLFRQILGAGMFAALCIGLGVALYGWLRGWQTATHYSNGLFVAGSAVIILGVLIIVGGFTSRGNFAMTYSQSVSDASTPDRTQQTIVDLLRGYNALAISAIAGIALIGLSILVYKIFG